MISQHLAMVESNHPKGFYLTLRELSCFNLHFLFHCAKCIVLERVSVLIK